MQSRVTMCFNMPGFTKTPTTRYGEALACHMIPLVWSTYDVDNILVTEEWQRCASREDFKKKVIELRDPVFFEEKYNLINTDYQTNKILTMDAYYMEMTKKFYALFDF